MDSSPNADPAASLTALIERARAAMTGGTAPSGDAVVGEAAEGQVRATIGANGRVESLEVDPRMLRQPLEDLSAQIVKAVNAGLDASPGRTDTAPLLAELKAVQEQSVAEMTRISTAFSQALARALPQ